MTEISPETTRETASPGDLFDRLDGLGISYVTHTHPPLFTVEDSKAHRGEMPGGHCKNLFLRDKKGVMWLVVVQEDRRIDLKALGRHLGANRISFASADRLLSVLGLTPGAVSPLALINDTECVVRPVLDASLLKYDPLNYHPLVNDQTIALAPADLIRFIEACGHSPEILDFDALNAD